MCRRRTGRSSAWWWSVRGPHCSMMGRERRWRLKRRTGRATVLWNGGKEGRTDEKGKEVYGIPEGGSCSVWDGGGPVSVFHHRGSPGGGAVRDPELPGDDPDLGGVRGISGGERRDRREED